MAKTWPATLPAPIANSVKLHKHQNRREIEFSAKTRRAYTRASNPPSIIECTIKMDAVQVDAFEYFLYFDDNSAAEWIDAAWLLSLGFTAHYCRFLELPKISKSGGIFNIDCVFEVQTQAAAIQMPTLTWPTSNKAPGPPIPQLGLVATYDAAADTIGNHYNNYQKLPDAFGSGFQVLNYFNAHGLDVVNFNGLPALKLLVENWSHHHIYADYIFSDPIVESLTSTKLTFVIVMPAPLTIGFNKSGSFGQASGNRSVWQFDINYTVKKTYDGNGYWTIVRAQTLTFYINGVVSSYQFSPNMIVSQGYDGDKVWGIRAFCGKYAGNAYVYGQSQNIHEIMVWNNMPSFMTAQERTDLTNFLKTKWLIV